MRAQLENQDQVKEYLATIFPTPRELAIYECEYGWVFREVLTDAEQEAGMGMGQENYVVNKETGVVTAHTSLHPITIGEMYDEDIRTDGVAKGYQVYPPQWEIDVAKTWESDGVIVYRVKGRSLLDPPVDPSEVEHTLTIDKRSYDYDTGTEEIHDTCTHAVMWAFDMQRQNTTWPQAAVFQV